MSRVSTSLAALAYRLARVAPTVGGARLRDPLFVVGFNNSGKSTVTRLLAQLPRVAVFPGEGNAELWYPGMFPWVASHLTIPPIWFDPEQFTREARQRHDASFGRARAVLGTYQLLTHSRCVVNDSGMLGALVPAVAQAMPEARFVHFLRDGHLSAYITARLEWAAMLRSPTRYASVRCVFDFDEVLAKMARYWAWTVTGIRDAAKREPSRFLEIRFEDAVHAPRLVAEQVAAFLDVPLPKDGLVDAREPDLSASLMLALHAHERLLVQAHAGDALRATGYLP